jgi:CBS domain-containing protein
MYTQKRELPPEFTPKQKFPYPTETFYPTISSFVPTLKGFLNEYNCSSPLFPKLFGTVISVKQNESLFTAFHTLIEKKIMCLPVLDVKTSKPITTFSMMDFVNILTSQVDEKEMASITSGNEFAQWLKKKAFVEKPLSSFPSIGSLEPMLVVNGTDPLLKAVTLMITKKGHRVLVVNEEGQLINLITQTRVLGLLSTVLDTIEESKKSLKEHGLGFKKVLTVPRTLSAFQGFKFLKDNNISGCGVTDESGRLVGNLSINDMKTLGFTLDYFNLLTQPLSKYLEFTKGKESLGAKRDVITITEDMSLMTAIQMMYGNRIHRLYIVDKEMKPTGILAMLELLILICGSLIPSSTA